MFGSRMPFYNCLLKFWNIAAKTPANDLDIFVNPVDNGVIVTRTNFGRNNTLWVYFETAATAEIAATDAIAGIAAISTIDATDAIAAIAAIAAIH